MNVLSGIRTQDPGVLRARNHALDHTDTDN
jgi:hypothetical protein